VALAGWYIAIAIVTYQYMLPRVAESLRSSLYDVSILRLTYCTHLSLTMRYLPLCAKGYYCIVTNHHNGTSWNPPPPGPPSSEDSSSSGPPLLPPAPSPSPPASPLPSPPLPSATPARIDSTTPSSWITGAVDAGGRPRQQNVSSHQRNPASGY